VSLGSGITSNAIEVYLFGSVRRTPSAISTVFIGAYIKGYIMILVQ